MRKARNVLKWVEWAMAVEGLCAVSMCSQAACRSGADAEFSPEIIHEDPD